MTKAEWGAKRLCGTCAAPFYDLHRYPIRCPKCDAEFRPATTLARSAASKRPASKPRGRPKLAPAPSEERVDPVAGSPPLRATDVEEVELEDDDALLDTEDDDADDDADEDAVEATADER